MNNPPTAPGSFADNLATPAGSAPAADVAVVCVHDPINILIVDDEPKNLTVLETVLDDPGYRLVRAESADQALLALVAKEFALLILDVRMPVMTGFELAHLIRQRRKTEQVPIIFLAAPTRRHARGDQIAELPIGLARAA
jgi:CheY-like chemotaxis protein